MWPATSTEFVPTPGKESDPGSPTSLFVLVCFGVHKDLYLLKGKLCNWPKSSG